MRQTWKELKNRTMTAAEQRKAHNQAERELAEIEIAQLRETLKVTQAELAERLKVTQTAVSRLESRSNWQLGTLRDYLHALGGEMEICAVFPNRTVRLTHAATSSRSSVRRQYATSASAAKVAHRR